VEVSTTSSHLAKGREAIYRLWPIDAFRARVHEFYEHFVLGPTRPVDDVGFLNQPGWLNPSSISWRLFSDPSAIIAVFASMMMQSAHPVIADAFQRFGGYEEHPEKRFWLTGGFYFATTFGSPADAEQWINRARCGHRGIRGSDTQHNRILVTHPDVLLYSHLCVIYSSIQAWEKYGRSRGRLTDEEKDTFCQEQSWAATAIGVRNAPLTYRDALEQLAGFRNQLADSAPGRTALRSIQQGNGLPVHVRAIYRRIVDSAVPILPQEHLDLWPLSCNAISQVWGFAFVESVRNGLPELSYISLARCRSQGERLNPFYLEEANRPMLIFPEAMAAGASALESLASDETSEEIRRTLSSWWTQKAGQENYLDELSSAAVERMSNSGMLSPSGGLTRLGAYSAAHLSMSQVGQERTILMAINAKGKRL